MKLGFKTCITKKQVLDPHGPRKVQPGKMYIKPLKTTCSNITFHSSDFDLNYLCIYIWLFKYTCYKTMVFSIAVQSVFSLHTCFSFSSVRQLSSIINSLSVGDIWAEGSIILIISSCSRRPISVLTLRLRYSIYSTYMMKNYNKQDQCQNLWSFRV